MSDSAPVFCGEVVEVDELGGGPDEPLRQVEPRAQLQGLRGEARGRLGLHWPSNHQARRYAHRTEHHLQDENWD